MAFSKVFNNGSWNVRGVMLKLNDTEVVLARKKVDICEIQGTKTDSVEENKSSPSNRIFLDTKGSKQLGMGFLVNKSLKVSSTNLMNERISRLRVAKKDKFKSKSTPTGDKIFGTNKKQVNSLSKIFMPATWESHTAKKNSLIDDFYIDLHKAIKGF